ncbi:MAG: TonB-dependent receptor [Planctomycetota bacterium]
MQYTSKTLLGAIASFFLLASVILAQGSPRGLREAERQQAEELRRKEALELAVDDVVGTLDTIVVTATRHDEELFDSPFHVTVTGRDKLRRARTIQDSLKELPGVHLQRTSYGQVSPFLRGFTGYHTLMMIDGIRLNNSVLRSGPNEYWGLVDGFSLDRVEAVFGPGSVLYGSDAVGGAVNAIPLRRRDYGPENSWDRRVVLRYSSAENSISGRAQVSGNIGEDFGFVLGASGGAFSDLNAGGDLGRQDATNYHNYFADGRFDINLNEHWSLGILAQLGRVANVNRVHRTVDGVSFHGTTIGSDLSRDFDWERDLAAAFLDGYDLNLGGFVDEIHIRLSWHRIAERQKRRRGDGRVNDLGFDVDTFGVAVEFVSDTALGRLTYGVDYYHDEVDSFRTDTNALGQRTVRIQGPVGDDASYDLLGLFAQNEIEISNTVNLIVGGRLTYAAADADAVEDPLSGGQISLEDDWLNVIGSVRVNWRAANELNLYAGVSQAFRAPNLSDLSRLDSARSGELEVPSPGIDPEKFLSLEFGAKLRWRGFTGTAAYHYTVIDDLVIRQPTGNIIDGEAEVIKRNGGDGHLQGVDLSLRYDLDDNWWVFGTFHWLDGQAETFPTSDPVSRTEVISRLPPLGGTLGLGWKTHDDRLHLKAWALAADRQDRLSTRDRADTSRIPPGGTPGYITLNLEGGYRIDEGTDVFLSIENLLDKNYRTHGSGLQEPGANLIIGIDFKF